jgi:hypothetical protein
MLLSILWVHVDGTLYILTVSWVHVDSIYWQYPGYMLTVPWVHVDGAPSTCWRYPGYMLTVDWVPPSGQCVWSLLSLLSPLSIKCFTWLVVVWWLPWLHMMFTSCAVIATSSVSVSVWRAVSKFVGHGIDVWDGTVPRLYQAGCVIYTGPCGAVYGKRPNNLYSKT